MWRYADSNCLSGDVPLTGGRSTAAPLKNLQPTSISTYLRKTYKFRCTATSANIKTNTNWSHSLMMIPSVPFNRSALDLLNNMLVVKYFYHFLHWSLCCQLFQSTYFWKLIKLTSSKTLSLFPSSANYTKFHIFWVVFQLNLSYWKRRWYTKVPEGTRELVE